VFLALDIPLYLLVYRFLGRTPAGLARFILLFSTLASLWTSMHDLANALCEIVWARKMALSRRTKTFVVDATS
jgi:hypothetical protein